MNRVGNSTPDSELLFRKKALGPENVLSYPLNVMHAPLGGKGTGS